MSPPLSTSLPAHRSFLLDQALLPSYEPSHYEHEGLPSPFKAVCSLRLVLGEEDLQILVTSERVLVFSMGSSSSSSSSDPPKAPSSSSSSSSSSSRQLLTVFHKDILSAKAVLDRPQQQMQTLETQPYFYPHLQVVLYCSECTYIGTPRSTRNVLFSILH